MQSLICETSQCTAITGPCGERREASTKKKRHENNRFEPLHHASDIAESTRIRRSFWDTMARLHMSRENDWFADQGSSADDLNKIPFAIE
jgi:hypothetical protein